MFHCDAFNEGLLDKLLNLRSKFSPVTSDLLPQEDGGELADVGGLGGAEVLNQSRDDLQILCQSLNLLLRLPPCVVVWH